MKVRLRQIACWIRISEKETAAEKGAVLILVAMTLTVLMGMTAMAADYGWLYYNQLNTRKAAEAAALAGVVHMPQPDCADPTVGTDPYSTAIDIASRNGYDTASGATVTPLPGGTCARLRVDISRPINTFFLRVFGYDALNVTETATAEQLPPLKLGSDEPYLGEDPAESGRDRNFFLAISGEDRAKGQGDAAAARYRNSGGGNPEYEVPSYYYAFEVPVGSSLDGNEVWVQVYDPQAHDAGGLGNGGPNDDTNDWVFSGSGGPTSNSHGWNSQTRFKVYEPDTSPNYWLDNNSVVPGCDDTYRGRSDAANQQHIAYDPALEDDWVTVCSISSADTGIYVIEVSSDYGAPHTNMINGFSIRGATPGGGAVASSSNLQVYGLGAMSLWQFDTGSNPEFKIARIDEVYAGSRLIVSLWDVSDIGSSASIEFIGTASGFPASGSDPGSPPIDCQVRILGDTQEVLKNTNLPSGGWMADSSPSSGTTCQLDFTDGQYNNEWVQFQFDIPADYRCASGTGTSPSAPGCWMFVSYSVSGSITDRTVWAAAIDGQPIHLVP